jgi:hypothetical protein
LCQHFRQRGRQLPLRFRLEMQRVATLFRRKFLSSSAARVWRPVFFVTAARHRKNTSGTTIYTIAASTRTFVHKKILVI